MKKFKFFLPIFMMVFVSCSTDNSTTNINEKIIGFWNLTNITQKKNNELKVLQNGNSTFEFKSNSVNINGNTYLNETGNYSYIISIENYFNPDLLEPKNNVLKIGNNKFVVEIDYDGQNMILTNYSDGRIIYYLSK
ncbi:hypothetical protein [Flavobacterium sp. DSR2-3-3]|uniref:hypothetical protein n=1 Tax=Flavobacterium sp. DSR2-3-3 TaxID=2804632 RepID=UPI003CF66449